jgi:hypothetical protein
MLLLGSVNFQPPGGTCSTLAKQLKAMISYLLSNGRSGNINNPEVLRVFYTRVFLHIEDEGFKRLKHVKLNRFRPAMQSHGSGSSPSPEPENR